MPSGLPPTQLELVLGLMAWLTSKKRDNYVTLEVGSCDHLVSIVLISSLIWQILINSSKQIQNTMRKNN